MNLLPDDMRRQLPKLYATENVPDSDKVAIVKYFTPDSSWTWYAVEFDGKDRFFGFVIGHFPEWGYFSLSMLQSVRGPLGMRIERDLHFKPQPMSQAEPCHFEGGKPSHVNCNITR